MSILKKLMAASATVVLSATVASAALPTAGLMVRLESDNVTLNGDGRVTSWLDQSGHGHNANAFVNSGSQAPLLVTAGTPTGRAAIRFNPTNNADPGQGTDADDTRECLDIAATPDLDMTADDAQAGTLGGITWYVVYQTNTATDNRKPIGTGYDDIDPDPAVTKLSYLAWSNTCGVIPPNTTLHNTWRAQARNTIGKNGTGLWAAFPENTTNTTDFYVGGGVWDNTNDTISAVLVKPDGSRAVVTTPGADAVPTLHKYTRIGATGGASSAYSSTFPNFFNGHVAAVLIYNRLLTTSEQIEVEKYLRKTYVARRPDLNGDKLVNMADIEVFIDCANGPSIPHVDSITCDAADFDEDNDVDQRDFATMQRCLTGELTVVGCE